MSLFKVTVNGRKHIVEAPSISTANAWGNNQLEVTVEKATAADLKGIDLDNVPEAEKGGKTKAVLAIPSTEVDHSNVASIGGRERSLND